MLKYSAEMKNNLTFAILVAGFVSAIFISSFFKLGFSFSVFLIFISIVFIIYNKFFVQDLEEKRKIMLLTLFLLSFALGVLRYEIKDSATLDKNLENNVGKMVSISGIISDEPQNKESQISLTVDFKNMILGSSSVLVSGKGIVSAGLYPEFHYGDAVNIYGKLGKPENFSSSTESGKGFDYISYLAKDDIFYTINFAKVSFISGGNGNPLKTFLLKIKNSFIQNINRVIPEPEASLLSGIELGAKNSMDKETTNNFRITGLSQIVVLSGYNVTIVAEAIMQALSFLPKIIGLSTGIVGIILFVIMSGSSSTAVRAGIMALIVILAQMTKRKYQVGRALVIAALIIILINPKTLVFDISFQLSFLATVAIIYVAPIFKNKFYWLTEKHGLRDIVASTIAAQMLVLPLILYKMGMLSLFALPANILVMSFVPITMFFGFLAGIFGFIWIILSLPFAWISFVFLFYMINVAKFFANLPFSSFSISWFGATLMCILYAIIAIWIFRERKLMEIKK